MKCWCDGIKTYICSECEKKTPWNRLNKIDKLDIIAYSKKLKRGESDIELAKRILNKNLCVSMIPKQASL